MMSRFLLICGLRLQLALLSACCWFTPICAAQESTPSVQSTEVYSRDIDEVQTDLDKGKTIDANSRLDATDKSIRGFEFDYLKTRAGQTQEAGKPVTDLIRKVAKPNVDARYGVLNPVNRQMVFICRDGSLRIHDLTAPDKESRLVKHPQGTTTWSGAFSQDGKTFLTGHQNGEVLVWDSSTWKIRHTIPLGTDWPVRELAVAPDGSAMIAESKSEVELWSLTGDQPKKVAKVGDRYNFGEGLAFSPKGDTLATGGMFDIILYDAKTGTQLRSMRHASYTMGLEFSPDGKRIASAPRGNVNKFLAVFDVGQDQPLFNAGPFGNYIAGMAFSPDGKRIAATGCEKKVQLFDAAGGNVVLTLKRSECSAKPAFTHDGRLLGWNEPDGFLFIELGPKTESQDTKLKVE